MKTRSKILVIDDDADMRELMNKALGKEGYDIHLARSASDGIALLQQESFDLVVLDIKMPEMDGVEALREIINIQRKLPVVLHSSCEHYRDNYLTWVAADYVLKTGDFTELKKVLARNLTASRTGEIC